MQTHTDQQAQWS